MNIFNNNNWFAHHSFNTAVLVIMTGAQRGLAHCKYRSESEQLQVAGGRYILPAVIMQLDNFRLIYKEGKIVNLNPIRENGMGVSLQPEVGEKRP